MASFYGEGSSIVPPISVVHLSSEFAYLQPRALEREDSQLDSHFDLSKWGDILSDTATPAGAATPFAGAVKTWLPLPLDLPVSSAGLVVPSAVKFQRSPPSPVPHSRMD